MSEKNHLDNIAVCEFNGLDNHLSVLDSSQPIVIFNSEFFGKDSLIIPEYISSYVDSQVENIQKCRLSPDELVQFSLTENHRSRFLSGEPILIKIVSEKRRAKPRSGGQKYDPIELRVSMELKANTFLVVERLRVLFERFGERRHKSIDGARDQVIWDLIHDWRLSDSSAPDEKACRKIFNTRMEHGRKSEWKLWFPHSDVKRHLNSYLASFDKATAIEIEHEVRFQKSLVISLTKCHIRAMRLRRTSNDIGKILRSGYAEGPGARDSLAATTHEEYVVMDELLPAAFAGDFNPTSLFPVHGYAAGYFDMMRIVGQFYRGYRQPTFTEESVRYLISAISLLEQWESHPWDSNDSNRRGDTFWAHAMSRAMSLKEWKKTFDF